jgi:hypothetical protein
MRTFVFYKGLIVFTTLKCKWLRWTENVTRIWETNAYRNLESKPHEECALGRWERDWMAILRWGPMEVGCEDERWIEWTLNHIQQWALVLVIWNLWVVLHQFNSILYSSSWSNYWRRKRHTSLGTQFLNLTS